MKLQVRHAGGELTVGSQKEFLVLFQRGVITGDDLVKRDGIDRWVRADELPWIRGMTADTKHDNRRLLWITVAMMVLGLLGVVWIQRYSGTVAAKVVKQEPAPAPAEEPAPGSGGPVKFRAR